MPSAYSLRWPTIAALKEMGGSATIQEIAEKVIEMEGFTDEQQAVLHGAGPRTEIEYRLAWCRTKLKNVGILKNPATGVWELTSVGKGLASKEDLDAVAKAAPKPAKKADALDDGDTEAEEEDPAVGEWKDELLKHLLEMSPSAFERLINRLLRRAGFTRVEVTGKTGDGGIDGIGVFQMSGLVSFPVFFQCKRYKGRVRSPAVRDFRGAMAGRGDKGLLVTTGVFTKDARQEATRDNAPPVDLIDGDRLCELLKEHRLGVDTVIRQVEDVSVDPEFFAQV
jgi:restriction system protein